MESNIQQENNVSGAGLTVALPEASRVKVLGILSIVLCWSLGLPGLVAGISALVISAGVKKKYGSQPELYNERSWQKLETGKILAVVGIVLSAISTLMFVLRFVVLGMIFGNGR